VDIGAFVNNGKYYSPPSFVTFFFLDHEARAYDEQGRILEIGYKTGETTVPVNDWNGFFALLGSTGVPPVAGSTGVPPVVHGQDAHATSWPAGFLRKQFQADEIAGLLKAAEAYKTAAAAVTPAQEKHKAADAAKNKTAADLKAAQEKKKTAEEAAEKTPGDQAKSAVEKAEAERAAAAEAAKKADAEAKAAQKALEAAQKAVKDILGQKREGLADSIQALVDRVLSSWAKNPNFYCENQAEIEAFSTSPEGQKGKGALANARSRLAELGILSVVEGKPCELRLLRQRPTGTDSQFPNSRKLVSVPVGPTAFEKAMLERFHYELLSGVLYPGIIRSEFKVNYVPPEISEPPAWRDVYHYDAKGNDIGWTRYAAKGDRQPISQQPEIGVSPPWPLDFTADGLRVLEKDPKGRPIKAQTVKYEPEKLTGEKAKKVGWPYWRPTVQLPGNEVRYYAYESEEDWKGKAVRVERLEDKKGAETK
jgi:hypothetical protein